MLGVNRAKSGRIALRVKGSVLDETHVFSLLVLFRRWPFHRFSVLYHSQSRLAVWKDDWGLFEGTYKRLC